MKVNQREPNMGTLTIPQPGTARGTGISTPDSTRPGSIGQNGVPIKSFENILSTELVRAEGLRISAHAERRMVERNVRLNPEDIRKIEGALQKAAAKGSRESLVIYGDLALVTSVKNRTIVTALEGKDMKEHVFTNIDSAVIIK